MLASVEFQVIGLMGNLDTRKELEGPEPQRKSHMTVPNNRRVLGRQGLLVCQLDHIKRAVIQTQPKRPGHTAKHRVILISDLLHDVPL